MLKAALHFSMFLIQPDINATVILGSPDNFVRYRFLVSATLVKMAEFARIHTTILVMTVVVRGIFMEGIVKILNASE